MRHGAAFLYNFIYMNTIITKDSYIIINQDEYIYRGLDLSVPLCEKKDIATEYFIDKVYNKLPQKFIYTRIIINNISDYEYVYIDDVIKNLLV